MLDITDTARFDVAKPSNRHTHCNHTPRDACPVSMPTYGKALDEKLSCSGPRNETRLSPEDSGYPCLLGLGLSCWVQDWSEAFFAFVFFRLFFEDGLNSVFISFKKSKKNES